MPSGTRSGAAAERPALTPQFCQNVVVRNTPKPQLFKDPSQVLGELGVIDSLQVKFHKAAIKSDLQKNQYSIDVDDISSGAAVAVSDCSASVQNNAK